MWGKIENVYFLLIMTTFCSAGRIYLLSPLPLISPQIASTTLTHLNNAFSSSSATVKANGEKPKTPDAKWVRPTEEERDRGIMIIIEVAGTPKQVAWHRKGDYFSTVAIEGECQTLRESLRRMADDVVSPQLRTSRCWYISYRSTRLRRHSSGQRELCRG